MRVIPHRLPTPAAAIALLADKRRGEARAASGSTDSEGNISCFDPKQTNYIAAVAIVSLFTESERLALTYHVNPGQFRSPLVIVDALCTHLNLYDAEPASGRFVGKVVAETWTQLRQWAFAPYAVPECAALV